MARPDTRQVDQVDDYFGTAVADPYRWLEDGDDPEVAAWLAAQAAHAREHLDALPGREPITAALDRAVRLPRSGLPVHRGARWFRTTNDGTRQQDVLVVAAEPFGAPRVLIDPHELGGDGSTSLAAWRPSPDGTLVAYSWSEAGSDWRTWRVRDVASGDDLPDVVAWGKFTWPVWLPDGSGFVYGCFDAPGEDALVSANQAMRLTLHRLGTPQAEDAVVFALPDEPDVTFWPEITEDGRRLVVFATVGTDPHARVWVRDLDLPGAPGRPVIERAEAYWEFVGSAGDALLLITDLGAPLGRLVALDLTDATMRTLVGERADRLESAAVAGDRLVVQWLRDASARLTLHDLDGSEVAEVALPAFGSIEGIEARAHEPLVLLAWTSFTTPGSVLALDTATGALTTAFADGLDSDVVTEQVRVTSADGTQVPVFVLHRPDVTAPTGPHPAWLYGYGGFRIPMTPSFEPTRFAFAEAGGVVAIACLRGGGEYGAPWHDAGRRANKQNVFDDAVAAATGLIDGGWTSPAQLGLSGRSNGGLLAGAVLTQRPELFAAVVPEVGVLDMLRFPLWTIGWAWAGDYGDPRRSAEEFRTLLAYSPLHNLREGVAYPPVLVLTGDHDDRVVPAHSTKFAARLQAVSPPDAIALLRVETSGGHKEGRSHDALVAERRDVLAFLAANTGLTFTPTRR